MGALACRTSCQRAIGKKIPGNHKHQTCSPSDTWNTRSLQTFSKYKQRKPSWPDACTKKSVVAEPSAKLPGEVAGGGRGEECGAKLRQRFFKFSNDAAQKTRRKLHGIPNSPTESSHATWFVPAQGFWGGACCGGPDVSHTRTEPISVHIFLAILVGHKVGLLHNPLSVQLSSVSSRSMTTVLFCWLFHRKISMLPCRGAHDTTAR